MTKDELIANQQIEIESFKKKEREDKKTLKKIKGNFISMGCPLNDNLLNFNQDQLKWCMEVYQLIEEI